MNDKWFPVVAAIILVVGFMLLMHGLIELSLSRQIQPAEPDTVIVVIVKDTETNETYKLYKE